MSVIIVTYRVAKSIGKLGDPIKVPLEQFVQLARRHQYLILSCAFYEHLVNTQEGESPPDDMCLAWPCNKDRNIPLDFVKHIKDDIVAMTPEHQVYKNMWDLYLSNVNKEELVAAEEAAVAKKKKKKEKAAIKKAKKGALLRGSPDSPSASSSGSRASTPEPSPAKVTAPPLPAEPAVNPAASESLAPAKTAPTLKATGSATTVPAAESPEGGDWKDDAIGKCFGLWVNVVRPQFSRAHQYAPFVGVKRGRGNRSVPRKSYSRFPSKLEANKILSNTLNLWGWRVGVSNIFRLN